MTHCTAARTGGPGSLGPEWAPAHRAWLNATDSLAIDLLKYAEQQETHRHD